MRRRYLEDEEGYPLHPRTGRPLQRRRRLQQAHEAIHAGSARRRAVLMRPESQRQAMMQRQMPISEREMFERNLQQQTQLAQMRRPEPSMPTMSNLQAMNVMGALPPEMSQRLQPRQTLEGMKIEDLQGMSQGTGRRNLLWNQPQPRPATTGDLRVSRAGQLEEGSPEWQRTVGIPQEPQEQPMDLNDLLLYYYQTGQEPFPGFLQRIQEVAESKRAQLDPRAEQIKRLLEIQRLYRGTRELGMFGQMGETMPGQEPTAEFARQQLTDLTGAPQEQKGLPAPQTEEEFMMLPSGTRFLAPDGTVRIKP